MRATRNPGIPASDYRMQFGLLVADIAAATEAGLHPNQLDQLQRLLVPRIQTIRNLDKQNQRGQLDHEIREARRLFQQIMGPGWRPNPDGQVSRALAARGVTRT